jgi:aspartyl protease family protein
MSDEGGPWGRAAPQPEPRPSRPPPRRRDGRPFVWLLFFLGLGALVLALTRAFPGAVQTTDQWSHVLYLCGFLTVLCAGALRARPIGFGRRLRYAAVWVAVAAVLVLGYAYREELAGVPRRLQLTFSSGEPVTLARHELAVPQDDQGAFIVYGEIDGQRVRFMVDTGATDTVLSPADARRLGVDVDHLRYGYVAETANGKGYGAAFTAKRLQVGPIGFDDFPMTVNRAPMSSSLLGLSFLNRLDSFEFKGRSLILKWRDGAAS